MREVNLIRFLKIPEYTLGYIELDGKRFFILERPWLDNKPNVSCIPVGSYIAKRDRTGKHQYYAIQDVPDREGIEIHVANRVDQLQGCIALGLTFDFNIDFLGRSGPACDEFTELLKDEDFKINIKWAWQ